METLNLTENKLSKIFVIKADKVSSKNLINNEFAQSCGQNTCYMLIDNKYIVAGSGAVEHYIGKNLEVNLFDDGNKTTKFPRHGYTHRSKVNIFANSIQEFAKQLPKGNYNIYAMK